MSTTLPHGIIQINEGNISWYGDITANWQLIDSKIGEYDAAVASIPAPANNGTLTINYGGTTIAMFGADDAGNVSANIPAPGDGTLTIQKNGTTVDTFTANSSSDKTVNIECVDLTNNQTVAGNKEFTGTTTAHDLIPSATDTYNFGSSSYQWNKVYSKEYYYNGTAWGLDKANTWTANQIIVGNNSRGVISIYNPTYAKGSAVSATDLSIGSIFMGDGGKPGLANALGFISTDIGSSGAMTTLSLSALENTESSTSRTNLVVQYDKNDSENPRKVIIQGTVIPHLSMPFSLGTSTNKWKSIYSNTYYLGNTAFGNIVTHNASEFALVSDLTSVLPIGSYIQFAGSQAPDGFLVCNGGAISRTTYSKLFAVIGTTYGSGDGSTTFNLPNLTDRFLQGSTTSGTVINAGLPNITGGYSTGAAAGPYSNVTGAFASKGVGSSGLAAGDGGWSTNVTFDASRSSSVYDNSTTVQPPALTCLICIKY